MTKALKYYSSVVVKTLISPAEYLGVESEQQIVASGD